MVDTKLSALAPAAAPADADLFYTVQGGVSLKQTALALKSYIGGGISIGEAIVGGTSPQLLYVGPGSVLAQMANLPTSYLNSGIGASSSTFWRGDGTWAAPAPSGATTGEWAFSTSTAPPVASGDIEFDNATQSAATNIYIHHISNNNNDVTHLLTMLLKADSRILVQDSGNSANYTAFKLTADATYTSPYFTAPVTVIDAGSAIANNKNCLVSIAAPAGGGLSIGDVVIGGTAGSILFVDGSGNLAQNNQIFYFYDAPYNSIRLGDNTPGTGVAFSSLDLANTLDNTWVGRAVASPSTTGIQNTAVGVAALQSIASGNNNTVVGWGAANMLTGGNNNAAFGLYALNQSTGDNNIGLGYQAAYNLSTGSNNVFLGSWQGVGSMNGCIAVSDGAGNLQLDYNYSASNVWTFPSSGINMLVNGASVPALFPIYNATGDNWFLAECNPSSPVTGDNNIGLSPSALANLIGGGQNIAIGTAALIGVVNGGGNIGIGTTTNAGDTNWNVAIGGFSLGGGATGHYNTCIGTNAGSGATLGGYNTLLGAWTGSTGISNVIAFSDGAGNLYLDYNFSASSVWTFPQTGINMLINSISIPALHPVYNVNGNNWFIGQSGSANITGDSNMGMGAGALQNLTTGTHNVAIGVQALNNCTTGYNNVGLGSRTLHQLTTGHTDIAIGDLAGVQTTGVDNTLIGSSAMFSSTGGNGNTMIGSAVGYSITYGSNNTIIGGQLPGFNITGADNITLIGNWQGPSAYIGNMIGISDGAGNLWLDYNYSNSNTWTFVGPTLVKPVVTASLPAAGQRGRRHFVTDATATTFASVVAGGGANAMPVYDDGAAWRIG